jgi:hypothetical protein
MRKVLLSRGPRSGMPRWQLFHHTSSLALHLNKGPASGPHTKDHRSLRELTCLASGSRTIDAIAISCYQAMILGLKIA